jgi:hypothetical protein
MTLWNDCFGDLSQEEQRKLKITLNKINKIVGLGVE